MSTVWILNRLVQGRLFSRVVGASLEFQLWDVEMSRPRVSIGVPVYNGQRYLERAVRSLLEQSFTDFEIILCDNASTDKTPEICQRFDAMDDRVRYYRNDKNVPATENFNRSLGYATGEYFKWAAHDDVCHPNYLARCVAALDADPNAALAQSRTAIIDDSDRRIDNDPDALAAIGLTARDIKDPPRQLASGSPSRRYADILLRTHWCFEVFSLFRTDLLRSTGELDDYFGSDKVMLATLALERRFADVDEDLFHRRHHAMQSSQSGMMTTRSKCLAGYLRAIWGARIGLSDRVACHGVILRYLMQFKKWSRIKA